MAGGTWTASAGRKYAVLSVQIVCGCDISAIPHRITRPLPRSMPMRAIPMGVGHAGLVATGPVIVFHPTLTPASGATTRISAIMSILWAIRIHRLFERIQIPFRLSWWWGGNSSDNRLGEHCAIPHRLGRMLPTVVVMTPLGEWEARLVTAGPVSMLAVTLAACSRAATGGTAITAVE